MLYFRDKNGREVKVSAVLPEAGGINQYHNTGGPTADELLLALLRQVPHEEFIELPCKVQ